MSRRPALWDIRVDAMTVLWRGRRLRVDVTLVNVGAVAAIPDPRRLRPTLRDIRNHGLATADITRVNGPGLSVFRPVVPPGGSVKACLQFERLPPDRAPASITIGEPDVWSQAALLPRFEQDPQKVPPEQPEEGTDELNLSPNGERSFPVNPIPEAHPLSLKESR